MNGYTQQRLNCNTAIRVIEEKGRAKQSYVATVGRVIEFARLPEMPPTIELALQQALQKLGQQGGDNCAYYAKLEA